MEVDIVGSNKAMIGSLDIHLNHLSNNLQWLEVNKRRLDNDCGDRYIGLEYTFNTDRVAIFNLDRCYGPFVADSLTRQEGPNVFSISRANE